MIKKLKKLNLLYVEDDIKTSENYIKTFKLIFKSVLHAKNYDEAMNYYKNEFIDLLFIDIELKEEKNGFDIVKEIRIHDNKIPIIFLTSHGDAENLLKAANCKINGYIIKPFSLEKIKEIINNFRDDIENKIIKFNNFTYNFNTYQLFKNNEKINLGKKENLLLQVLLKNKTNVLKRDDLEYYIWNETFVSDSALKNLISSLRKKIGKNSIQNISKIGWRIIID